MLPGLTHHRITADMPPSMSTNPQNVKITAVQTVFFADIDVEPVSGFEPLTVRLQGRFRASGQLLLCWSGSVCSSSWYCSMSLVSARFWHGYGTRYLSDGFCQGAA
jgi:hypothetical protein